jgi:hypothetical protein
MVSRTAGSNPALTGGNELAHEVDWIINVEKGQANGKGRFRQGIISI